MDLLKEILSLPKPSIFIKFYEDEIFELIPELKKCKGFNQNNEWHIYDVYNHILHVVDSLPMDYNLRLAGLFHDIGKPQTYTEDEKGIGHFYGHWDASKELFIKFAKRNRLDEETIKQVSKLIEFHDINISSLSEENLNKLVKIFSKEELIMLFQLKKADLFSQNIKYRYLQETYQEQARMVLKMKEII